MPMTLRSFAVLATLLLAPALAQAGWVIEWDTTATNNKGERMATQQATQSIAANRVAMQQPEVVTIIDYGKDRFTIYSPERRYFWSGTLEEYRREMVVNRERALRKRVGQMTGKAAEDDGAVPTPRAVDPSKLPPVSITAAGSSQQVAGYEAQKYDVKVDGELFEELWVAPVDVSADLDVDRFLAQQVKNSAAMQGKSADAYSALYRDPEYRRLLEKALVVRTVTHHLSGSFERLATSIAQREVADATFAVPDGYRKVRLGDVLAPPPEATAPTSPSAGGASN